MYTILLKAGIQKHKGMLIGISILIFLVSLALGTVLTVFANSASYLNDELHRAGFGTLTAWVSGAPSNDDLATELATLEQVERVEQQALVFSNYTTNGQESDSEGQLIAYEEKENRYRFFTDDLAGYQEITPDIARGEVYVSPSLISMFGINLGDSINFSIARNGGGVYLTVKGFYEDPFMGSSMIGMKGFLVSEQDMASISATIKTSGIDALAREGAMLHIFGESSGDITTAELSRIINQGTQLPSYTEFVHSAKAISGFMLVLQNAFCALLLAFVLVLLLVVLVALGHGITSNIEADYVSMGILKAVGFTSTALRQIQLLQYFVAMIPSMLIGLLLVAPVSRLVGGATLTTTGILIPNTLPLGICLGAFPLVLAILYGFIVLKTAKIKSVQPMTAIRGEVAQTAMVGATMCTQGKRKISGEHLNLSMAVRQIVTGKKKYISACLVAVLLVFFASTIGRMDAWLGADGKGMMEAFNPADHDIGVQMFGQHTLEDAQEVTGRYTEITDSYQLAMVSASVNGTTYTANVITEPKRFHILDGRTSIAHDEIVVTEFVAADLGVLIGDTVTVTGDIGSHEYTVSGIYACANDMGANIGMNREGYLRIAQDNPQIWCDHYFLADTSQKPAITQALTSQFGGDVHVHENTWPGLVGIILAMRALVVFMYVMVVLFTLIIVVMTASKILATEKRDMGIFKAIGFTNHQLKLSFALRFGVVASIGSVLGAVLAATLTDLLVSAVMKLAGISNFVSAPSLFALVFPVVFVTLLFTGFAYLAAEKIKRTDLTVLVAE